MTDNASKVWPIILAAIIFLAIYSRISSKISLRRRQKLQQEYLPLVDDALSIEKKYNIYTSDGINFLDIQILGMTDMAIARSSFRIGGDQLVLKGQNGKRIFLNRDAIKYIEES